MDDLLTDGLSGTPNLEDANHLIMAIVLSVARLLAFFAASPFFGRQAMLRVVRLGLALALSVLTVPATFATLQLEPTLARQFLPLLAKELVIGFFLGFLLWMPVRGLELAGVILDTQTGSTMAQELDVIFGAQITPTAILLVQVFSAFFFATGGFLMVQQVLFTSTEIWPPTEPLPAFADEAAYLFIRFAGGLIFMALVFALPISGFMVLADIVIAFLARSAPTLNALTFGMPVKSVILLIMLVLYMNIAFPKILDSFAGSLDMIERLFVDER